MPADQKYENRYTTSVSLEKKLHKIARALGVNFSDGLTAGLHFYIRMRIADKDPRLTPELLEDFKDLEFKNIKELEAYIRLKNEEQKTLEMVCESQKPEELVEVWSHVDEAYIRITRSQYEANPGYYILKGGSK